HPVGGAVAVAVVDAPVLGQVILALRAGALLGLMLLVEIVERGRADEDRHLLLAGKPPPGRGRPRSTRRRRAARLHPVSPPPPAASQDRADQTHGQTQRCPIGAALQGSWLSFQFCFAPLPPGHRQDVLPTYRAFAHAKRMNAGGGGRLRLRYNFGWSHGIHPT